MKRNLILRTYQIPAINYIRKSKLCVLAVAPNGGKTEISIQSIENFLEDKPKAKILVLAHSTNVLLMNYYDRLEELNVNFTYSKDLTDNSQVHVTIPHQEENIVQKYDYLIVDEAHENYLKNRVQRIIKKIKPKKQLLLTGTPSKFITKGGFDIFPIAANEISSEWFSKLNLELVTSSYDWMNYYNNDQEVNSKFKFNYKDTKKTLESVLEKLIFRLQTKFKAKEFNHSSTITKLKTWVYTYKNIGKTLISCKDIYQAELVNLILQEKGVNCKISHSKNDKDSDIITQFKNNEFDVLVVVNRARLGYSDNDLVNLIDMTGSHNPDIIYQMFCRVVRGTPNQEKYYIKVTPKKMHNMAITHISVCAALMLTDRRYLTTYNGKNFNEWKIPIIAKMLEKKRKEKLSGNDNGNKEKNNLNLFPEFTNDIIDTMRDVLYDANKDTSIYKMATISEVRYQLDQSDKRPTMTFEEIIETIV